MKATLPVFFPDDDRAAVRLPGPAEWQAYADWMLDEGLITRRQAAEQALTNEFLAGEGLDPRDALEQD